jgi:nuclear cap-binding protein subunit 1
MELIKNVCISVTEQPFKIPFVAAVVLVVNTQKPELVVETLKRAAEALQGYLNVGAWREVKLILRFLGCLQRLFEGEGIFPILDELFSRAVDLQTASSEDVSICRSALLWKYRYAHTSFVLLIVVGP